MLAHDGYSIIVCVDSFMEMVTDLGMARIACCYMYQHSLGGKEGGMGGERKSVDESGMFLTIIAKQPINLYL